MFRVALRRASVGWHGATHNAETQCLRHISTTRPVFLDKDPAASFETIKGAFSYVGEYVSVPLTFVKSKLSFGGGVVESVMLESVERHLYHLYIPSLYQFIQLHTGLPWIVVMACGTVLIRAVLFPITTRKSMSLPNVLKQQVKVQNLSKLSEILMKERNLKGVKKVQRQMQGLVTKHKIRSTVIYGMFLSPILMISINLAYRHILRVQALTEGGVGPFLDMTAGASVAYYTLPLVVVAGLSASAYINVRHVPWMNKRVLVIAVPVACVVTYLMSTLPVGLVLHYSISSWIMVFLFLARDNEWAREKLKLPKNTFVAEQLSIKRSTDSKPVPQAQKSIQQPTESDKTLDFGPLMTEDKILEEFTSYEEEQKKKFYNAYHCSKETYYPYFKVGPYAEEAKPAIEEEQEFKPRFQPLKEEQGGLTKGVKTMTKGAKDKSGSIGLWFDRVKLWFNRNKLLRHAKTGNQKEFIGEAPIQVKTMDPVMLSTKVTPGLKRYVLRKQYPMDTLEELERKISYMERVQNKKW